MEEHSAWLARSTVQMVHCLTALVPRNVSIENGVMNLHLADGHLESVLRGEVELFVPDLAEHIRARNVAAVMTDDESE